MPMAQDYQLSKYNMQNTVDITDPGLQLLAQIVQVRLQQVPDCAPVMQHQVNQILAKCQQAFDALEAKDAKSDSAKED